MKNIFENIKNYIQENKLSVASIHELDGGLRQRNGYQKSENRVNQITSVKKMAHISHASKVMLKIFQARLQQCVNCDLPDVQAGFRKGKGTRDQIANIC